MNKKELDHFRALLLEERKRILEELGYLEKNYIGKTPRESSGAGSTYTLHPADVGTDSMELEKAYLIGAAESGTLEDIEEALGDIAGGRYGLCQECGEALSRERLEAIPYARLCVKCKSMLETPGGAPR